MRALAVALLVPFAIVAVLLALGPVLDRVRQRALRRILQDVAQVFNAHGIAYWCDFGTLLGLHREGDIILGDKDADLCVLEPEKGRVLALAEPLRALGLEVRDVPDRKGGLLRIHDRITPYYTDVYVFVRDGEMLRSLLAPGREDVPGRLVHPTVPLPFLGTTLLAPGQTAAMCRHRYGPDFMVPRRNDKGTAREWSRLRSLGEDIEYGAIGGWGLLRGLRRALGRTRDA
jgi:hypothetical protein